MTFNLAEMASVNRTATVGITSNEVPDPTPLPKPHAWMVIVRPVAIRKKTNGGILLPETMQKDYANLTTVGRVLALGPDAFKVGKATQSYDVGDYVVWSRMRGERFVYKGISLVLLADDDVLMTIPNPEDLDPDKQID